MWLRGEPVRCSSGTRHSCNNPAAHTNASPNACHTITTPTRDTYETTLRCVRNNHATRTKQSRDACTARRPASDHRRCSSNAARRDLEHPQEQRSIPGIGIATHGIAMTYTLHWSPPLQCGLMRTCRPFTFAMHVGGFRSWYACYMLAICLYMIAV